MLLRHLIGEAVSKIQRHRVNTLPPFFVGPGNAARRGGVTLTISNPSPSISCTTSSPTSRRAATISASATVPAEISKRSSASSSSAGVRLGLVQYDRHQRGRVYRDHPGRPSSP